MMPKVEDIAILKEYYAAAEATRQTKDQAITAALAQLAHNAAGYEALKTPALGSTRSEYQAYRQKLTQLKTEEKEHRATFRNMQKLRSAKLLGVYTENGQSKLIVVERKDATCLNIFLSIFNRGKLKHTSLCLTEQADYLSQFQWKEMAAASPEHLSALHGVCLVANNLMRYVCKHTSTITEIQRQRYLNFHRSLSTKVVINYGGKNKEFYYKSVSQARDVFTSMDYPKVPSSYIYPFVRTKPAVEGGPQEDVSNYALYLEKLHLTGKACTPCHLNLIPRGFLRLM